MEKSRFAGVKGRLALPSSRPIGLSSWFSCGLTLACLVTLLPVVCLGQQPSLGSHTEAPSTASSTPAVSEEETPLPGDWAPELLYGMWNSPNSEAADALYRAAFAAGPSIIPQLKEALKDDRTAEFAAQSLAFIGGEKAMVILDQLVGDPRDLNLRRFFYGALAEYDSPQATDVLLDVINKSDSEPDRTVTEAAILALTVRSDTGLLPKIRAAEHKLQDFVIRDDLGNAYSVIEARAKYLASPTGKMAGGSLQEAVRTYFMPALEGPPNTVPSSAERKGPSKSASATRAHDNPPVSVEIPNITFSPDKTRALARVIFEDPSALAKYDIVLQKQSGNWTVVSVWLGPEISKVQPATPPATPRH